MSKARGKPFNSKTARQASLNSPWRKRPACMTRKAHESRKRLDEQDRAADADFDPSKVPF